MYIPIPDDLEYLGLNGHLKVYRIEDDGTLTDMDAVVEGNCIMFTTDHFSLYTLVGYESAETPENPDAPGTDPTQPGDAATKPNQKPTDEPMDEGGNGGVVVIVIVAVVLVLGAAAAIVFARKKK